jgi:hypothetical protein
MESRMHEKTIGIEPMTYVPTVRGTYRRFLPAPSMFLMFGWFSIVYLPVTVLLASRKHLWNDELFTYYIAQLAGFSQIWEALLTAADQNPPLFYWLTHVSMKAPVGSLLAIRLPEVLGFWLMGICLIAFVSRHVPAAYGLMAALIALVSGAYPYAYEARPYGIVLGLAALAMLCWQRTEGPRVALWAIVLSLTLAFAVSVHYYSVLIFVPLAVAETVRWYVDRKPRWPVLVAFIAGGLPLLAYLPLIRSASAYSGTFWAKVGAGSLNDFLSFVLVPALLPLAALGLWASTESLFGSQQGDSSGVPRAIRHSRAEFAAVLGFSLLPVITIVIALAVTGAYTHRYALCAVTGISVLGAWMMSQVFRARSGPALIAVTVLSLFFIGKQARTASWIATVANHQAIIHFLETNVSGDSAVGIADPHLFFEISHQAPGLRGHIFYVAQPDLALRHVGTDAVDRGVMDMSRWAPLRLRKLADILASSQPFMIFGYPAPAPWAWIVQELASLHVPMSVRASVNGRLLLVVNPKSPAAPSVSNSGRDGVASETMKR